MPVLQTACAFLAVEHIVPFVSCILRTILIAMPRSLSVVYVNCTATSKHDSFQGKKAYNNTIQIFSSVYKICDVRNYATLRMYRDTKVFRIEERRVEHRACKMTPHPASRIKNSFHFQSLPTYEH
jgi:hypothetical protein